MERPVKPDARKAAPPPAPTPAAAPRQPPRVSAAELRHFAQLLEEQHDRLPLPADPLHSAVPAADARSQQVAQALAADLRRPEAQRLAEALALGDGALDQVVQVVERQQAAQEAFQEVWSVRTSARRGAELVDRARQVARALVHAEVHRQLGGGEPSLTRDVADLRQRETRALMGRPIEAVATRAFLAHARLLLQDPAVRQLVQTALQRVPDQRVPDWDALAQAVAAVPRSDDQEEAPAALQ